MNVNRTSIDNQTEITRGDLSVGSFRSNRVLVIPHADTSFISTVQHSNNVVARSSDLANRTTIVNLQLKIPIVIKIGGTARVVHSNDVLALSTHHNLICSNTLNGAEASPKVNL